MTLNAKAAAVLALIIALGTAAAAQSVVFPPTTFPEDGAFCAPLTPCLPQTTRDAAG